MNRDSLKTVPPRETPPMSVQDFADWGLADVAYIKPVEKDGRTLYAVFAANGRQLGVMETLNGAHAALVQNDLEPISLH